LSKGSKTLDMTSEGLGEVFEGDSADMCAGQKIIMSKKKLTSFTHMESNLRELVWFLYILYRIYVYQIYMHF
jgi:hypothetical protein